MQLDIAIEPHCAIRQTDRSHRRVKHLVPFFYIFRSHFKTISFVRCIIIRQKLFKESSSVTRWTHHRRHDFTETMGWSRFVFWSNNVFEKKTMFCRWKARFSAITCVIILKSHGFLWKMWTGFQRFWQQKIYFVNLLPRNNCILYKKSTLIISCLSTKGLVTITLHKANCNE